ncbi:hypothetical protein [Bacteriovorax sp. Seq25_V]|uniref:hypothetical protein n=1 Tax=Bacteriovorax sp. Seq25_V TaxID=1201288 RepID=UPI0003F8BCCF|nr:hypothetical protein [Bacteriovorax sp. Seq25_V]
MDKNEFQILKEEIKLKNLEVDIISDSMGPYIKVGQAVEVTRVDDEFLKPFDIIIFRGVNNKLICHFILKVIDDYIITCSTKNIKNRDLPILKDNLLGKVVGIELPFFIKLKVFFYYLFS